MSLYLPVREDHPLHKFQPGFEAIGWLLTEQNGQLAVYCVKHAHQVLIPLQIPLLKLADVFEHNYCVCDGLEPHHNVRKAKHQALKYPPKN